MSMMTKGPEQVKISIEDLRILLICSERYALGRRTYMPGMVCDIIKKHADDLSHRDIGILLEDIEHPVCGYGDECDKHDWLSMAEFLKERLEHGEGGIIPQ